MSDKISTLPAFCFVTLFHDVATLTNIGTCFGLASQALRIKSIYGMAATEMLNGSAAAEVMQNGENKEREDFKLRFCTVCASNQNR